MMLYIWYSLFISYTSPSNILHKSLLKSVFCNTFACKRYNLNKKNIMKSWFWQNHIYAVLTKNSISKIFYTFKKGPWNTELCSKLFRKYNYFIFYSNLTYEYNTIGRERRPKRVAQRNWGFRLFHYNNIYLLFRIKKKKKILSKIRR